VLIVDFYDSFTYNLAHYFEKLDCDIDVLRNDELDINCVSNYDKLILSPGPGLPTEKENLLHLLEFFTGEIPILGICLGMQAIGIFKGGQIQNQLSVKHGVSEKVNVLNHKGLFKGLPTTFEVGLYHSWEVINIPHESITSVSENEVIMAIEFPESKLYGVQFHPESIMTEYGLELISNFLNL